MPHCDDDELSVIALGESPRPEDEAHLAQCPRCRSRLDQLAAVVGTARTITAEDRPLTPPDFVWAAIADELNLGQTDELAARRDRSGQRRTWRVLVPVAAAIVGVVAGGAIALQVVGQPAPAAVVATGSLAPIDDSGLSGTASVETSTDGTALVVSVADLPPAEDGYYEVWMATADTVTMVSMGAINPGTQARLPIPDGMDVSAFPVVDVSLEHFDGDPGHSATSLVRGTLSS